MMGSFRGIVVGRPSGRRPGRIAQTVDIAYPALHNPAAKGASLMTRRVVVLLVWLCMLAAAPVAAQEPLRLGVLTIRSGPIASCGRQMEEGLQWALKERGGMLGPRKVGSSSGHLPGQPAQPRARPLELVERNRVHVLTGRVAAFEAYATSDYVRQTETPMVISPAAADDITQRKTNPWFV